MTNKLQSLNIPNANEIKPNASYKSSYDENEFEPDPFYYHLNTFYNITPIEKRGSMIRAEYKGVEILIPEKIIKLKPDSLEIWVHSYIFSQILDKNGFDGEYEVENMQDE